MWDARLCIFFIWLSLPKCVTGNVSPGKYIYLLILLHVLSVLVWTISTCWAGSRLLSAQVALIFIVFYDLNLDLRHYQNISLNALDLPLISCLLSSKTGISGPYHPSNYRTCGWAWSLWLLKSAFLVSKSNPCIYSEDKILLKSKADSVTQWV